MPGIERRLSLAGGSDGPHQPDCHLRALDPVPFPSLKRSTPQGLLAQWFETYRATGWPHPVFELAFRWLGQHCPPPPTKPRLVHGDFRNGNLMFGHARSFRFRDQL